MNPQLQSCIILSFSFLALFGVSEILYHFFSIKAEYTRKLVHLGTGLITLTFPLLFNDPVWVVLLCASFLILLIMSLKFNFLKSINAIDRKSVGSLMYPVIVVAAFYFYLYANAAYTHRYSYFYLPILILAICDPMAALVGKNFPAVPCTFMNQTKTLSGSLAFFLSALVICIVWLSSPNTVRLILTSLIISVPAAVVEACSRKGYDNLFIPLSVMCSLSLCESLMK